MNQNDYFLALNNINSNDYDAIINHIDSIVRSFSGRTCVTKARRFETILFYEKYLPDFINNNYSINLSATRYECRCIKKVNALEKMWEYPKEDFSGIYLIGQCIFNPYTKEEYYLLKVGESSSVAKRLKQYKTYNPHIFLIDTFKTKKENTAKSLESSCHSILEYFCHFNSYENTEWYIVDRDFYLNISKKGLSFLREYNEDIIGMLINYDRR